MALAENGKIFGEYRLVRQVGRGAMATVWEAVQLKLRRRVAIKILHEGFAGEPKAVRRFLREAEAAGRLQHPNIVAVYDRGQVDGVPFIVMELIEGPTLAQVIRRSADPTWGGDGIDLAEIPGSSDPASERIRFAAEVGATLADALQHAHEREVTHRDIKPTNILLQGETPKLADFGLADVMWGSQLTATGEIIGTPAYMSPEQALGKDVDRRADVYALGATIYELLTLRRPIHADTLQDYFQRIPLDDPEPIRTLLPEVPKDLETILAKAMAKDPAQRYRTAAALADDLRSFLRGGAITARPEGRIRRAVRRAKSRPVRTTVVLAGLSLLLGLAIVIKAWPEPGSAAYLTVVVEGGDQVPVRRIPLDELGTPQWDQAEDLDRTPLRGARIPPGEAWFVVGRDDGFVTRWVRAEAGQPEVLEVRLRPNRDIVEGMVRIEGSRRRVEDLRREIEWRTFHIDRYEVTYEEFYAFLRETGHQPETDELPSPLTAAWARRPANVCWYDAMAFAEHHGKRLPTTEEWYAAWFAGGPPTEGHRRGHPSRSIDEIENDRTGLGVIGMFGNVSEWTLSWTVRALRPDGTMQPATQRIVMGRSFGDYWENLDSRKMKRAYPPDFYRSRDIGFRCARSAVR